MPLLPFLHRVSARQDLSVDDAHAAMEVILDGRATTAQIASFLVALKMKGETADELQGFVQAMRHHAQPVICDGASEPLIDTCGTGGDGLSTFNISTVAAFVIAGAGVRVAKHGNRSISSRCGSADIFEALGVNIHLDPRQMAGAIRTAGIAFLFAPALHPAVKHSQAARLELKMRTAFNLIGPLANPAGARHQLIGAPSPESAERMAHALAGLGTDHAFVVHGLEGLDEVSTIGATIAHEIRGNSVTTHTWVPEDFGVPRATLAHLAGGDRDANRAIARRILDGEPGAARDIVLVNASVALVAAGRATGLRHGVSLAAESIDSGSASRRLAALVEFSQTCLHARINSAS